MPSNSSLPEMPILSVTQLTQAIKLSLEATFPMVCVQGEVSNCKQQSSGHVYFSLKDSHAQISAVMFRGDATRLARPLRQGDEVMVRGELNVYPPRGSYQIIVRDVQLAGIGQLLLKLEALKAKLKRLGWFSNEQKQTLPRFPKTIGVITSPTGAAIQDIVNVLTRRSGGFHLLLYPVKVQGEGAATEIAQAIRQCNQHKLADVLIVGRGGGSIEDLWAFNEEVVAEAIFHSCIPIISAVGHETDTTLADLVADVRAPTPSAAAEIVVMEREQQLDQLNQYYKRLTQNIAHHLKQHHQKLESFTRQPVLRSPAALMGLWCQRLDDLKSQIDHSLHVQLRQCKAQLEGRRRLAESLNPLTQLRHYRTQLTAVERSLNGWIAHRLETAKRILPQRRAQVDAAWNASQAQRNQRFKAPLYQHRLDASWYRLNSRHKERLEQLNSSLRSIAPQRLLERGYSILFSEKDRSIISSVRALRPEDTVCIRLMDGDAHATITSTDTQ